VKKAFGKLGFMAWFALTVLPLSGAAGQAAPLVVETRGGVALPVGSFADGDALGEGTSQGPSMGVELAFSGSGRRTFYVGFSQHRFVCRDAGCRASGRYVATGFNTGFRFGLVSRGRFIPWIRLGAVTSQVESPGVGSSPDGVGHVGYGGEAGVGVYLGAWSSVALNPGVRLTRVVAKLPGGRRLSMRYVVADLGFSLAF
jgi:hypothetical protein